MRSWIFRLCMLSAVAYLGAACSSIELASHYVKGIGGTSNQASKSVGDYKVGSPYRIGGTWYYPEENFRLVETGIASWYGPNFHGKKTANGEIYDQYAMTAAHRTLQIPSIVKVTNLESGRTAIVRINDRGPYARGRVIDLSKKAAQVLGVVGKGTARVRLQVLEQESRKIAELAKQGKDTSRVKLSQLRRLSMEEAKKATPQKRQSKPGIQMASLKNDAQALPESLQTPTITVEELNRSQSGNAIDWGSPTQAPRASATRSSSRVPAKPVQTYGGVQTQLFVQAGAFSVKNNALRLKDKLSGIAPVIIDPLTTSTGKTLYRVKLGPMQTVREADQVLSRVIDAGERDAMVIR